MIHAHEQSHWTIERLMVQYYPAVHRLALSILNNPDDAEDAAQESFIAAALGLDEFQGNASPKTWLFRIAINVCRGQLRKRKARQALLNVFQSLQRLRPPASVEESLVEAEGRHQLWEAVDCLSEKHRLPVLLYYVHDLPVHAIAKVLGLEEGTVHSRLYYARQQLLRQLRRSEARKGEPASEAACPTSSTQEILR